VVSPCSTTIGRSKTFSLDRVARGARCPNPRSTFPLSTISVALSKRLAEAHARGRKRIYRGAGIRQTGRGGGKLVVAAAGPASLIEQCRPLFEAIGRKVAVVGTEPWQANVLKLSGNFLIASMLETLGDAFALLRKSGIDPHEFLDIVNGGLFQSPVYENYGKIIAERKFEPAGFRMLLGFKDIRLLLAAAESSSVSMPIASLVRYQFLSAIARGKSDLEWAGITEGGGRERRFVTTYAITGK
jgi:3-hydroxyisobutyrate dehydrogenase-like beta-hydroxyacid dehydrogenase